MIWEPHCFPTYPVFLFEKLSLGEINHALDTCVSLKRFSTWGVIVPQFSKSNRIECIILKLVPDLVSRWVKRFETFGIIFIKFTYREVQLGVKNKCLLNSKPQHKKEALQYMEYCYFKQSILQRKLVQNHCRKFRT